MIFSETFPDNELTFLWPSENIYFWQSCRYCILRHQREHFMEKNFLVEIRFLSSFPALSLIFFGFPEKLFLPFCRYCFLRQQRNNLGKNKFFSKVFYSFSIIEQKMSSHPSNNCRHFCQICILGVQRNSFRIKCFFLEKNVLL